MGDYWNKNAEKLQAELAARGVELTAPGDVIAANAGGWFAAMSENEKASVIATMRVTVIADCPEINTWTTGHAAGVTSLSQAGIELHADKLSRTSSYATNAGQPTFKFDVAAQRDEVVKHSVTIGKTADAHSDLAQTYRQIGVTDAEFADLQPKP